MPVLRFCLVIFLQPLHYTAVTSDTHRWRQIRQAATQRIDKAVVDIQQLRGRDYVGIESPDDLVIYSRPHYHTGLIATRHNKSILRRHRGSGYQPAVLRFLNKRMLIKAGSLL